VNVLFTFTLLFKSLGSVAHVPCERSTHDMYRSCSEEKSDNNNKSLIRNALIIIVLLDYTLFNLQMVIISCLHFWASGSI